MAGYGQGQDNMDINTLRTSMIRIITWQNEF